MRPLLIAGPRSCDRCRARLGGREADPEVASLALDRGGADLAPHHVDHAAGDRQAEAEALVLARLRAPVEALEDALDLCRGYAGSCVDHFHHTVALAIEAAANGNAAGGLRVLTGVGEEADEHLAQQRRVAL